MNNFSGLYIQLVWSARAEFPHANTKQVLLSDMHCSQTCIAMNIITYYYGMLKQYLLITNINKTLKGHYCGDIFVPN